MNPNDNNIVLRDIDIPFSRLIAIMLKLMFASIPAVILFYLIIGSIVLLVTAFFGGAAGLLQMRR